MPDQTGATGTVRRYIDVFNKADGKTVEALFYESGFGSLTEWRRMRGTVRQPAKTGIERRWKRASEKARKLRTRRADDYKSKNHHARA
jgi:hypothetical protein